MKNLTILIAMLLETVSIRSTARLIVAGQADAWFAATDQEAQIDLSSMKIERDDRKTGQLPKGIPSPGGRFDAQEQVALEAAGVHHGKKGTMPWGAFGDVDVAASAMGGDFITAHHFKLALTERAWKIYTEAVSAGYRSACNLLNQGVGEANSSSVVGSCRNIAPVRAYSSLFKYVTHFGPSSWATFELESMLTNPEQLLGVAAEQNANRPDAQLVPVSNPKAMTTLDIQNVLASPEFRTSLDGLPPSIVAQLGERRASASGDAAPRRKAPVLGGQTSHNLMPKAFHAAHSLAATLAAAARMGLVRGARGRLDAMLELSDAAVGVTRSPTGAGDSLADLVELLGPQVVSAAVAGEGLSIGEMLRQRADAAWGKVREGRRHRYVERIRAGFGLGESTLLVPRPEGPAESGSKPGLVSHDRMQETLVHYASAGVDSPLTQHRGPIDPAAALLARSVAMPGAAALVQRSLAREKVREERDGKQVEMIRMSPPDSPAAAGRAIAALVAATGWEGTTAEAEDLVPKMLKAGAVRSVPGGTPRAAAHRTPSGLLLARQAAAATELRAFGSPVGRAAAQPDALLTATEPAPMRNPESWAAISERVIEQLGSALAAADPKARDRAINSILSGISVRPASSQCGALLDSPKQLELDGRPVPKHLMAPPPAQLGTTVDATDLAAYLACAVSVERSSEAKQSSMAFGSSAPPLVPVSTRWPARDGKFYVPGEEAPLSVRGLTRGLQRAAQAGRTGPLDPMDPLSVPAWAIGSPNMWKSATIPGFWWGQILQDRWVLEHVYPGLEGGYFVEAGAVDGRAFSNTIVMEQHYNWTGVLVEARQECIDSIRHFRPRSTAVRALLGPPEPADCTEADRAVGASDCEVHREYALFYPLVDSVNATARYIDASTVQGVGHLDDGRAKWRRDEGAGTVPSKSLQSVLREAGAPSFIHFLSLDVEGFEWEVLRGFDFEAFSFGALAIEHNFQTEQRARVTKILLEHGYVREMAWSHDDLFLHESVARELHAREAEARRRRRGRARRPDFGEGMDWAAAQEMYRAGAVE